MGLKTLLITNLFPTTKNSTRGIFILEKLQQYEKFDASYTAVSLGFKDDLFLMFLKRILKGSKTSPSETFSLEKYQNVRFLPVIIKRNIFKALENKIFSRYYKVLVEQYVEEISLKLDVKDYDLIHAHGMYHVPAGMVAERLAEKYNKPFLITVHGSDVNLLMPKRKKEYIEIFEKASKVMFVSRALLEKARSMGYSGRNAVIVPNGFDPKIFYPMDKEKARKDLGIYRKDYKYVGFVGNLIPIKRADRLPDIFHHIAERVSNVYFIVVGDGFLRREIEEKTKDLDIVFTGRISQKEVAKYMNAMDVMILPSRNEGWPCVVLEAQACGTPVVGSDNGGIPEAVGDGGIVVEEGEDFEKRFAQAVVKLLESSIDEDNLRKRASRFSWKSIVKKEIEVYNEVLNRFGGNDV